MAAQLTTALNFAASIIKPTGIYSRTGCLCIYIFYVCYRTHDTAVHLQVIMPCGMDCSFPADCVFAFLTKSTCYCQIEVVVMEFNTEVETDTII